MIKMASIVRVAYARRVLLVSWLLISLCTSGVGAWQVSKPQVSGNVEVRERIAVLIKETLDERHGVVDGVRIWSRVPPSNETVEEIKRYGDDAVPPLRKYLDSDDERERALAVVFLGLLGGRRIIIPLQNVIRYDASPTIRISALRWISQTPWELASPIIREATERDVDPMVREAAKDLLVNHDPK